MKTHIPILIISFVVLGMALAGSIDFMRHTEKPAVADEDPWISTQEKASGPYKIEQIDLAKTEPEFQGEPDQIAESDPELPNEQKITAVAEDGFARIPAPEVELTDSGREDAPAQPVDTEAPEPPIRNYGEQQITPVSKNFEETQNLSALPSDEDPLRVYIKTVGGNIREAPSMEAPVMFWLPWNTPVTLTDRRGNWYSVMLDDGREGWGHRTIFSANPDLWLPPDMDNSPPSKLIHAIRTVTSRENEIRVIFELNGNHPPDVSATEGRNPRVICEFKGVGLEKSIDTPILVAGDIVEQIMVDIPDTNRELIRIELDLVGGSDYAVKQLFFEKNNNFVVIVRRVGDDVLANPQ